MQIKGIGGKLNKAVLWVDNFPLWALLPILLAVVMAPILALGEGSVFDYHDQWDEYMMNTVLTARHLGDGTRVFPEMMGGITAAGLQPAGILFVPLYRVLPAFWAFILQYAVCFATAFLGMYFCVKEITGSSILAMISAGCFCILPLYPVYALSEMGIPMVIYAFIRLWREKTPWIPLLLIAYFGLGSHLVYTGYVVLTIFAVGLLASFLRRKKSSRLMIAFVLLLGVYVAENRSLFLELLLGQGGYVSHREEMVTYALPFWKTVWEVFTSSAQHAPSLHRYLILPIVISIFLGALFFAKLQGENRKRYILSVAGMLLLFGIALLYGILRWQPVVERKNSLHGFLHYFQMERFYWLYPAGWYLEFALCCSVWWKMKGEGKVASVLCSPVLKLCLAAVILYPTVQLIKESSYLYMNVNQYNNGSGITGYISWESYYAEDLMQQLEEAIGKDMSTYRVAHLGICPAPALMHGFYTVDGYSNNYPLEYKHRFRKAIARELEKNEQTRLYFDEWGNRCYLFNGTTGNAWMLGKNTRIVYEELEFDMGALWDLDCRYLFSCGEIKNAEELGLSLMGCYETPTGYWRVWLYELNPQDRDGFTERAKCDTLFVAAVCS